MIYFSIIYTSNYLLIYLSMYFVLDIYKPSIHPQFPKFKQHTGTPRLVVTLLPGGTGRVNTEQCEEEERCRCPEIFSRPQQQQQQRAGLGRMWGNVRAKCCLHHNTGTSGETWCFAWHADTQWTCLYSTYWNIRIKVYHAIKMQDAKYASYLYLCLVLQTNIKQTTY